MRMISFALVGILMVTGMTSCQRQQSDSQTGAAPELKPIPDKLVVLTFDDRAKSWRTFVGPLLQEYGFGATFYVTNTNADWFGYHEDPKYWISWEELRELNEMGFELGNHSETHAHFTSLSVDEIVAQELEPIEIAFKKEGLPQPVSCAYPAGSHDIRCVKALERKGYLFGRRAFSPEYPGSLEDYIGPVYDPLEDHPYLIPAAFVWGSAFDENSTSAKEIYGHGSQQGATVEDFASAVDRAKDGKIAVVVFHGVPDYYAHASTAPEDFTRCMDYLRDGGFKVIALRDLVDYVDPARKPADPYAPIQRRIERMAAAEQE
ncbi:MAG: polysaccharide deacetylase family protein [Pirellulaceae bacterium]|nr:polysaccharide deacetylase family protein [Pirellulaceae bacterium]